MIFATSELAAVGALLFDPTGSSGLLMASVLCFVVVILSGWALLIRSTISCGCFGSRRSGPLGIKNLVAGAVMFGSALLVLGLRQPETRSDSLHLVWATVAIAMTAVVLPNKHR